MKKLLLISVILILSTQVTFSQLWEECNNGLYGEPISSILVNGNKTFVIKNTSLYLTTDDGISWEIISGDFAIGRNIKVIEIVNDIIFVMGWEEGWHLNFLFYSFDKG